MEISVLACSCFIDGIYPCPSEFLLDSEGVPTKESNPKFSEWIQQEQNVLAFSLETIANLYIL